MTIRILRFNDYNFDLEFGRVGMSSISGAQIFVGRVYPLDQLHESNKGHRLPCIFFLALSHNVYESLTWSTDWLACAPVCILAPQDAGLEDRGVHT